MQIAIKQILTGKVQPFGPKGEPSAYIKTPFSGTAKIDHLGLQSDQQADTRYHGGPDKALLHYAFDHYECWRTEQPQLIEHFVQPGAFGENISSLGITEQEVCIGDQFQLGTAVVEVSQGRQPCWKLAHRFTAAHMVKEVIRTGRSGWYYRVIKPGNLETGDKLELLERKYPQWVVDQVTAMLIGNKNNTSDTAKLTELAKLKSLSSEWRTLAQKRLNKLAKTP